MRYDFELTKAELLRERFNRTYLDWCKRTRRAFACAGLRPRLFPAGKQHRIRHSEGESWTTNWLKHRLGEEMGNEDYRRGRGYTMINKFVSSAAHLTGKRVVSCEEMTNTYQVFNATLEFLKLGSDMSILSGITHSVLIGVNVSPSRHSVPGLGALRRLLQRAQQLVALHALLHRLPGPRFGSAAKHRHVHRHRAAAGLSRHVERSGRQDRAVPRPAERAPT